MNPAIRAFVKARTPAPLWNGLKTMYLLPQPASVGPAQATVFICDEDTETYIGVNNHFSWLAAQSNLNANVRLNFYDEAGNLVLSEKEKLGYFHSRIIDVRERLSKYGISAKCGMFSLGVEPVNRWNPSIKRMGTVTGIFYVLHTGKNGSVALLHPNARVGDVSPTEAWKSLQVVSTAGMKEIVLYQLNAGQYRHVSTHKLLDADTDREVASTTTEFAARSTHKIIFDLQKMARIPERLCLAVDALPSSNAKPLLQRNFLNGQFTISHA